jgi:UDP-2,3-diacylglucosamine pyrophosphatase LpxH
VKIGGRQKVLRPPKKIILLGDILELWDSRDQNRDNVFLDAVIPFAKLQDMDCDVIYVTGNHDENVGDIVDASRCPAGSDSIDLFTRGDKKFSIFKRSYIPYDKYGLKVGNAFYAFLHGHQFDQEQIIYTISRCLGHRFDPVGYIADIANNYVAKSIPRLITWLIFLTWVFLVCIYFFLPDSSIVSFLTVFIWSIAVILLVYDWNLFRSTCKKKLEPALIASAQHIASITLGAAIIITIFLVLGHWLPVIYFLLFLFCLIVYSYFFAVMAVPKFFGYFQRDFYTRWTRAKKAKDKTPKEVITGNFEGKKGNFVFFDPKKYTLKANVVVFGHTHCAADPYHAAASDLFAKDYAGPKEVFFYNAGCWENDSKLPKEGSDECRHTDTLVYIDTDGIFLMRWDDAQGKIINSHYTPANQINPGTAPFSPPLPSSYIP